MKPEATDDWFSQVAAFFVKHGMLDQRDEYDISDVMSALADNYAPEATEGEEDRLRRMVERRDEFIIANGLWDAFKEVSRG